MRHSIVQLLFEDGLSFPLKANLDPRSNQANDLPQGLDDAGDVADDLLTGTEGWFFGGRLLTSTSVKVF